MRTNALTRHGNAVPVTEPLVPPIRPRNSPSRRIGVNLDMARYVAFRTFAAEHGLTGEQVAMIAIDRLLTGR